MPPIHRVERTFVGIVSIVGAHWWGVTDSVRARAATVVEEEVAGETSDREAAVLSDEEMALIDWLVDQAVAEWLGR